MTTPAAQMDVAVCLEPGHLRLEQRPLPRPKAGEALVRIQRIGVCGTDIHAFSGRQPYFSYPRVLGHELAGTVEALADDVPGALRAQLLGQQVYVIPYLHCGQCRACQRGTTNCCQQMQVVGVHQDGGMAEWLTVPVGHLVACQTLTLDELALVECQAIGAHAVRRAAVTERDLVAVVGTGPIGIGVAQVARAQGARVVVLDSNAERLAFCREALGFHDTLLVGQDDPAQQLVQLNQGALADVVFDATGNPAAMEAGFELVGHGGRYVLVSLVKADIRFHDPDFHAKEVTLLASRNATGEDFARVIDLLATGQLKVSPMITHRAELCELPATMAQWCDSSNGVIKAMISVPDRTTDQS